MIAVVDYGMGNLRSVQKGFQKVGMDAIITGDPKLIADASHIVLPGVGAFKDCMQNLEDRGLVEPVVKGVKAGKPFLGICLGLQLLFEESEEFGSHNGLGLIKGKVARFPKSDLKVPHMGWNDVHISRNSRLLNRSDEGTFFYFVHSYYVVPSEDVTVSTTDYGQTFTSSIEKDNIFACQFHPEKSQDAGLKLLKRFGETK
ncbi:MAG: imidazole glycerol phosphate synthase subunit HisH [Proteobacteria bacterium]|nr:imidazole glycerol phosphate synthase subunit HisH [Pseudomonadota bacterium]